jgi:hypothetical protein
LRLLSRQGQPAPVPDDHSLAQEAHRDAIDEHRATLALDQRVMFDVEDEGLAQSLMRWAKGVMQPERKDLAINVSSPRGQKP